MAKYKEDLDLVIRDDLMRLVRTLADEIGDCKVVDNVIYRLASDFEYFDYTDKHWHECDRGIFEIYKIEPGKISVWTSKISTLREIDLIGKKPFEYFADKLQYTRDSLKDFVKYDVYVNDENAFIDAYGDILDEDLDLNPVGYAGWTLQEVYDEIGESLFDEDNIPLLKEAGLIDENGYPINEYESWDGRTYTKSMDIYDIYEMDYHFIDSQYVQDLMMKELFKYFKVEEDGNQFVYKYKDTDLPDISNFGKNFVIGAFCGDLIEYFDFDVYDFKDCNYYIDDIDNTVLDLLESYGLPRDIYKKLMNNQEDEDSPLSAYYEDLKFALQLAVTNGYEVGSANQAASDFDDAWRESIPNGCEWLEQESTEEMRPILVKKEWIENNLEEIWDMQSNGYSDIVDAALELLSSSINNSLEHNYSEPYYGWDEFDEEAFNDRLLEEIMEIDIPAQQEHKEKESGQMNLFDFDDEENKETNVDEDLSPTDNKFPIEIGPRLYGHTKKEVEDIINNFSDEDRWIVCVYDANTGNWEPLWTFDTLSGIYSAFSDMKIEDNGAVEIIYCNDVEAHPELDASYVVCGKYGPDFNR